MRPPDQLGLKLEGKEEGEKMITHRIAVVPGDGIGKEVIPEGIRVLEAVGRRFDIRFLWQEFPWSCEAYTETGRMMPEDGLKQLCRFDAIFLGAVGFPGVPDHISLWGLLIPIRRHMRQYINLRPVQMLRGMVSPLRNRTPKDIDFCIVRENNEGEYSEIGGRLYTGTDAEMVVQETVFTRKGVDRVLRYAFELARKRKTKHVTSATKSNGIIHTMPYWDERFNAIAREYPDIQTAQYHIDIPHFSLCPFIPTGSMWWWGATSLVIYFLTWVLQWLGASVSHRLPISTRPVNIRPCSNRYTVQHLILPARVLPIPLPRSGQGR